MNKNDLSFLVGCELQQIAVGRYQVIFNFFESITLSVESGLEFESGAQKEAWVIQKEAIPSRTPWLTLIGQRISTVEWLPSGNLQISFGSGKVLTLIKGTTGHESFQVTQGTQVWVY